MSGLPSSKNYGSCRRSSNDEPSVSSQASSPKAARKLSGRQIVRNFLDEVFGDGSPVDYVMQTVNPVAVEDLQLVESEEELQIWLPDLHRCQIRKLWKALEVLPSERTYLLAQNASEPQDVLSQVNFMPFVGKASSPRFADASPEGPKLRRLSSSCQSWPAHAPGGAVMVENRRFFEDTGLLWIDVCGEPLESRPVSWEEDYKNYLEHLAESYGIHPASIEDCLTPGELPKTEFTNGVTFCLMRYCVEHPISGSTQDELSDVSSKVGPILFRVQVGGGLLAFCNTGQGVPPSGWCGNCCFCHRRGAGCMFSLWYPTRVAPTGGCADRKAFISSAQLQHLHAEQHWPTELKFPHRPPVPLDIRWKFQWTSIPQAFCCK